MNSGPFGFSKAWRDRAERRLRLESTARPPGRPKKPRIGFVTALFILYLPHDKANFIGVVCAYYGPADIVSIHDSQNVESIGHFSPEFGLSID